MLKLHQIVFRKFLVLFLALFFIVGGIIYYWLYEYYTQSTKEALKEDIVLLSYAIDPNTAIDILSARIQDDLDGLRLTIIDGKGDVIADSHKNSEDLQNQRYEPEILDADKTLYGTSIRKSRVLNKEYIYVARKYHTEHASYYIRVAKELVGVTDAIYALGIKIILVLILFFIALMVTSYRLNKQVQYEMDKIVAFLKSLTKKKKSTYITSNFSDEFEHITHLLTKVSQILVKKDKQKEKYTNKLQLLNKQKDDIISAISHEFKNPIAVVNGYSQTLLEDMDLNHSIRKKFLKKIYNNGLKLSSLIDTLRLSIKLDSQQQNIQTKEVNLYNLVEESIQGLEITYPYKEIDIEGDKDTVIKADPTLFGIVITNLIENAFKYSEDEVIVRISSEKLVVKDTGVGIAEDELKKITEKFYRVQTNSWNNSLGLGLFLVQEIVALHNFSLKIKSKKNKGSTFTIEF